MTGTNFSIIILVMNFIFWNCRGARNNEFCEVTHDMRRLFRCNILAVADPRVSGVKADKIIKKLNFENSFRVEAQGMSGGLWLLWNQSRVNIKILESTIHFIHGIVNEGSIGE